MFPPRLEVATSRSGASAVTVTDSCSVEGDIWRLMTAVWPTWISILERVTVEKPASSAVI
jgi:hypothetical protein